MAKTNKIEYDVNAAREFLEKVHPDGPWTLTAIATDKKDIDTASFDPTSVNAFEMWFDQYARSHNIYWSVNPTNAKQGKKARREDIKEVKYLHVDIDPREYPGRNSETSVEELREHLQSEQKRIFKQLKSVPKDVPKPTFVVFSGGGLQACWRLKVPIPIEGSIDAAEEAKLYNLKLEHRFGADACHNIDRIFRLPGSINWPDAKKKKKGRTPQMATLAIEDWTQEYSLDKFAKAQIVQGAGAKLMEYTSIQVDDTADRLSDVNELDKWSVPDRVKVIIVQGRHPDEEKPDDDSRSAWLFDALCNMARCDVPAETMYSVITDPGFGISESVIDKGRSMRRYALRQIERAKEEAIDPWLRAMNERHAVIGNLGGKCRIIEEVEDEVLGRSKLTVQTFEDIRNRYSNKFIKVGENKDGDAVYMPVGKWWLQHGKRRQYDRIIFSPEKEVVEGCYNLWQGYAFEPQLGKCEMFVNHVRNIVCSGNETYFDYLIKWMATCVQHPAKQGETAVVLRGNRGSGKSFFVEAFGSLFGRHFLTVTNPAHLVGQFNGHLRDCIVLFADEAFFAGDKRHESILKGLVTSPVHVIEKKGIDADIFPNFTHLLMASNSDWVVPAGEDERRFFVLDTSNEKKQNISYFKAMSQELDNGGREALLHMLMHMDLSDFEVRTVPSTEALSQQKSLSLGEVEKWWLDKLQSGLLTSRESAEYADWGLDVPKWFLHDDYLYYAKQQNLNYRLAQVEFGKQFKKLLGDLFVECRTSAPVKSGTKINPRTHCVKMPNLFKCRDIWYKRYGFREWEEEEESRDIFDEPAVDLDYSGYDSEKGPDDPF